MEDKFSYLKGFNEFEIIFESNDKNVMLSKLKKLATKISVLPKSKQKRYIIAIVTSLLSIMYSGEAYDLLSKLEMPEFISVLFGLEKKDDNNPFKDFDTLRLSEKGIEFIKNEEQLRLTAYDIKDGHITVGWGHAEPIERSKYKVGQKITLKEADRLLRDDLRTAEQGVISNIKKWNKDIKMTQDQFDVLVSLAYNKGVSGLFNSGYMKDIKQQKWIEAGKKIRKDYKKGRFMGGHSKRRRKESNLFFSFLKWENEKKNS